MLFLFIQEYWKNVSQFQQNINHDKFDIFNWNVSWVAY